MTTVIEENRKALRKAVDVECGFNETSTQPTLTSWDGTLLYFSFIDNKSLTDTPAFMDLGGIGFANDGVARPINPTKDSYRYGTVTRDVARNDGTIPNFQVRIEAAKEWEQVTLEFFVDGVQYTVVKKDPVWANSKTTITIENGIPGRRAHVTGVYLGKHWSWTNENLISVNLDLRSVSTQIGGELEASSIEIKAYEPNDVTDIIGFIPEGAPIWYSAGYDGDMSERRNFYLSEPMTWEDNVLTVKGQDATMLLDNKEIPPSYHWSGGSVDIPALIVGRIKRALQGISYTQILSPPSISATDDRYYFEEYPARTIISDYTNIYRNPNYLKVTYVDAGIPRLMFKGGYATHTIYADEISELTKRVEQNISEIGASVASYTTKYSGEIETIDATAGDTYLLDLDPPVGNGAAITPTPTSMTVINPKRIRFVAAATTQYTLTGYPIHTSIAAADDPYSVSNSTQGVSYTFENEFPVFTISAGSITKLCLPTLLNRSNIVYEFTYRGNPHIQPRDTINVEVATWVDEYQAVSGLWPETDLYPSTQLYPNVVYKKVRKMVKEWVEMTVDTITLEHSDGGGLTSKITARKGAV